VINGEPFLTLYKTSALVFFPNFIFVKKIDIRFFGQTLWVLT
jgi:hypothetical protein